MAKDREEKLVEIVSVANQMLDCLMTEQQIRLWQDWRSWGKISSWREQVLAQIELFRKLNKELNTADTNIKLLDLKLIQCEDSGYFNNANKDTKLIVKLLGNIQNKINEIISEGLATAQHKKR